MPNRKGTRREIKIAKRQEAQERQDAYEDAKRYREWLLMTAQ